MYHTFFFFKRLSAALAEKLVGARLMECFSQQKDELILVFYQADGSDFYVRADLQQGVCLLTFPEDFRRSRANSVALFPQIVGALVMEVVQTRNDRSFHLHFANQLSLCFKMYGNRSNLLLHNGLKVLDVFNHHLKKDLENPLPAHRDLAQDHATFLASGGDVKKLFPTFDKALLLYWTENLTNPSLEVEWKNLQWLLQQLDLGPYFICRVGDESFLSFVPLGEVLEEGSDPLHISNRLAYFYWRINRFFKQKDRFTQSLVQEIFRAKEAKEQAVKHRAAAGQTIGYRLQADLLMAYGHQISRGAERAQLPDFVDGKPVEIRLKKDLSVAENAERLYRKAKGQELDINRLEERILFWASEIEKLQLQKQALDTSQNWNELKPFEEVLKPSRADSESLPYYEWNYMNYEIRIGKNAKANDELLRLAHKDDLWLHARDVAGSHVIIRNKKGQTIPVPVKERAAQLAAFFSKARGESLVPVMATERKYVRKVKGTAAGMVKVEREKTLLAQPLGLP